MPSTAGVGAQGIIVITYTPVATKTVSIAHSNTVALSNGLVGYWTFDGGTLHWNTGKVDDVSGNGNTGQLISMNTTTSPVTGEIGQALKFNGTNQYISIPYSATYVSTHITVSFWMKTNASLTSTFATPLARGYNNANNIPWFFDFRGNFAGNLSCSTNPCYFDFANYTGTSLGCIGTTDFKLAANIGKWYFVTGTFDGSTYKLYLNSALSCSSPDATALAANTLPAAIGD